ncbi:MAG: hypothetical protein HYU80_02465 [Candidatus Blackburnbacteria bacterium]|nr:hypothetical protein [Candidatus Blackburnbacteria bacterium]
MRFNDILLSEDRRAVFEYFNVSRKGVMPKREFASFPCIGQEVVVFGLKDPELGEKSTDWAQPEALG